MRARTVAACVMVASLVTAGTTLAAQEACRGSETPAACLARMKAEVSKTPPPKEQAAQAAKKTEPGLADLANGLTSSMKDYLPLFQLAGMLGPISQDPTTGIVGVSLNKSVSDDRVQVRALIDTKPKLHQGLLKAVSKDVADTLNKALVDGSGRPNISLEIGYGFEGGGLGRSYEQYAPLAGKLVTAGLSRRADASLEAVIALQEPVSKEERGDGTEGTRIDHNATTFEQIPKRAQLDAEERRIALSKLLAAQAVGEVKLSKAMATEAAAKGLTLIGQLISNQPQLHVKTSFNRRDVLLGPDRVRSFAITFEMAPGADLRAFKRYAKERDCIPDDQADGCLDQFVAFTKKNKGRITGGQRFAFSAEAIQQPNDYLPKFEDKALPFSLKAHTTFTLSADYGHLFGVADDGTAAGRVDLAYRAERIPKLKVIDDPEEKVKWRSVLTLTLTKKFGQTAVPFSIVYANRSAYFPKDYDHHLTANVALKFSFFQEQK